MKAWEIWSYQRGHVTPDRRRVIIQTMIRSNDWIV